MSPTEAMDKAVTLALLDAAERHMALAQHALADAVSAIQRASGVPFDSPPALLEALERAKKSAEAVADAKTGVVAARIAVRS